MERHTILSQFPVDAEHLHRYTFAQAFVKDKKVLDIACGEGYGSSLISLSAASVLGVDVDEEAILIASKKYQKTNLTFKTGSLLNIPAETNSFDVVVSFETLEHIIEHEVAIAEIKRVLKPTGILVFSTPNKIQYSDNTGYQNPFHLKELYREELKALLDVHFTFTSWYAQRFYHASLIIPEVLNQNDSLKIYQGSTCEIIEKNPQTEAVYFITVSSNNELKGLTPSLFDLSSAIIQNHKKEVEALYNSKSYKIGNYLVRLARVFKSTKT